MAKTTNRKALNAIFTGKWAIETNHFDMMIGIATREYSDMEAVLATPLERRQSGMVNMRNGVAVINVYGPIFPHADMFTDISGATSVETLMLRFGEAINAPEVKAIILNVDSPGGNVTGINEFSNMIYNSRGIKPIVAYTGGLCASAGYWIASSADKIVADRTAFIGSIGVVTAWTDDSEARKKEGFVDYEIVSSQTPDKRRDPNSKEGRAKIQAEIDALADIFFETVARNRGTNVQFVGENYGKGGVLLSDEAVKVGMADSLGSLEGVIAQLSVESKTITINTLSKGAYSMSEKDDEEKRKKNGAEDSPDDDEKEDEEKESSVDKQMAALLANKPQLYNAIKQVGAKEERERIRAIDDVAVAKGYTDLVRKAMFDTPMSAADLALQIIKADGAAINKAAIDYKEDAIVAGDVPASVINNDKNADGLVSAMVSGFKAGGGKEVGKHGY
jgi:capsid assembly protease